MKSMQMALEQSILKVNELVSLSWQLPTFWQTFRNYKKQKHYWTNNKLECNKFCPPTISQLFKHSKNYDAFTQFLIQFFFAKSMNAYKYYYLCASEPPLPVEVWVHCSMLRSDSFARNWALIVFFYKVSFRWKHTNYQWSIRQDRLVIFITKNMKQYFFFWFSRIYGSYDR